MNDNKRRDIAFLAYLDALERGDIDAVADFLQLAERDPELLKMFITHHQEQEQQTLIPFPNTNLTDNSNPEDEQKMIINTRKKRKRKPSNRLWWWVSSAAASIVITFASLTAFIGNPFMPVSDTLLDCSRATVTEGECLTLIDLYQSTQGQHGWRTDDGWMQSSNICTWYGVGCYQGHVTQLNLSRNDLVGQLPDLSRLAYLEHLDLSVNNLQGRVNNLDALVKARYIDLSNNPLGGILPDLTNMPDLEYLNLSRWDVLVGRFGDSFEHNRLRHLNISRNAVSGEFPDFRNIPMIEYVDLSHNEFEGQIMHAERAERLYYLDVSFNNFEGLRPNIDIQYEYYLNSGLEDPNR